LTADREGGCGCFGDVRSIPFFRFFLLGRARRPPGQQPFGKLPDHLPPGDAVGLRYCVVPLGLVFRQRQDRPELVQGVQLR